MKMLAVMNRGSRNRRFVSSTAGDGIVFQGWSEPEKQYPAAGTKHPKKMDTNEREEKI